MDGAGGSGVSLRQQLLDRLPSIGMFFKTPSAYQQLELLGDTGIHFVALDVEHAPFNIASLDACVLAARSVALPVLSRVPAQRLDLIGRVLDVGASGVIVPHVSTAQAAQQAVAQCRFRGGKRGVSTSPRAGNYGRSELWDYLDAADREVSVIVQIEDAQGVKNVREIASVPDVDGLLIGPVDLAVGLGASTLDDDMVEHAISQICHAADTNNCAVGIYLGTPEHIPVYRSKGISFFIVGSEQRLIQYGAKANVDRFYESLVNMQ